ncbi:hypothetical protein HBH98_107900 [Parastagonospora nodorum]|nr:hypothetical protein HBH54_134630 [Parastagonospora nodorum]KAH3950563.1 hypothetical protein HBH53_074910 [Parastagonospora nodorum]KAH4024313.1 hypothetical protein HBI13_085670 [Parastagonospora nodorum]KAH4034036.1 hypothetical protein HBI09_115950 [Parastagonospora nodorum]KAH4046590.1 hypothetical protein HBH49_185330 [Parastagonospora nodorum]
MRGKCHPVHLTCSNTKLLSKTECLVMSLKAQEACSAENVGCICTTPPLLSAIQGCVLSSCTLIEALSAQNSTQTMCGAPVRDITDITPIMTGVFGGLAILGVAIRCVATKGAFALDDIFAVAALIVALPMGILEFVMSSDGFGKDLWTIPPANIYRIAQFTWLTEIFYVMAVALTKMSFLCFCLRVFPRRELRSTLYTLLAVSTAYGLAFTLTCIFNCTPISYIWQNWDGEHSGKCINFHIFGWAHAGINIALDVVIIGVPIPELLRLSMSVRKKVQVVLMFSIGAFATIISIIRLQSLVQFASSTNPTYDNVPAAYWSVLEAFVGIFCICMPAMRRFLRCVAPDYFGSTKEDSRYKQHENTNIVWATIPSRSRLRPNLTGSGITKTVDTQVESQSNDDDEIEFVMVHGKGRA